MGMGFEIGGVEKEARIIAVLIILFTKVSMRMIAARCRKSTIMCVFVYCE